MTSKEFESKYKSDSALKVEFDGNLNALHLLIGKPGEGLNDAGIHLKPEDLPALALAELETGGWIDDSRTKEVTGTPEYHVAYAISHLRRAIEAQEEDSARAEEREQLRAEGLALENARRKAIGLWPFATFNSMPANARTAAVAMARKARGLTKEAESNE